MKTTHWQTKALTLFIAAVALWLTAACGNVDTEYPGPQRVTPSAPCGPDAPLTQSIEFAQLEGTSGRENNRAVEKRMNRLRPERERIQALIEKHFDMLQRNIHRQYDAYGFRVAPIVERLVQVGHLRNENDEITDKLVIEIQVREFVDQNTLPLEDRIPECLEGVEVHFTDTQVIPLRR